MSIESVYLNDLNRVTSDINELIWYMEQNTPNGYQNAKIRADYIMDEVHTLVKIIKKLTKED